MRSSKPMMLVENDMVDAVRTIELYWTLSELPN